MDFLIAKILFVFFEIYSNALVRVLTNQFS